ncbi:class I SAM-dependent methyltransferase [Paracoccaceae bacterium]|nr:class I SAM-dependent methyltransferase [Paracoccaceae bacterium]
MKNYYEDSALDEKETIYDVWERGGAVNDSITPSTYSEDYRQHMGLKLKSIAPIGSNIVSLGSGNAFVESDLQTDGRQLKVIDINERAVQLARDKGLNAYCGDFYELESGSFSSYDVIYADGFIDHLFTEDGKLENFFNKLKSLHLKSGAWVVISNDPPRTRETSVAKHETVPDFFFVGADMVASQLVEHGFILREKYYFPYFRPQSGLRDRTVCIAQVA